MKIRLTFLATALLFALVWGSALASDQDDILKALPGRQIATCMIQGQWALVDVGNIEKETTELILLRRYKGEWRTVPSIRTFSPTELGAMGMSDSAILDFGLGTVDPDNIRALRGAISSAHLNHISYNVITCNGHSYAFTWNDRKTEPTQVWVGARNKWQKLFLIPANQTQAQIDALFDKAGISRFIEYRILVGRGEET